MRLCRASVVVLAATLASAQADLVAPITGSLVIVGGGEIPDGVRMRFFSHAGGGNARIVVIPTASSYADRDDAAERYLGPWRELGPTTLELVHVPDGDERGLEDAVRAIDAATGVWLGGGDQSRLVKAYRGTPVYRAIQRVLERGGAVGGTSAGAACMSDPMIARGSPEAELEPGFGLLPGIVIDQHFRERDRLPRLRGVIAARPDLVGIGLDESTALEVEGRRATVIGLGGATVVFAAGGGRGEAVSVRTPGAVLDVPQLRLEAASRAHPVELPSPEVPTDGTIVLGGGDTLPLAAWRRLAGAADDGIVVVATGCARPEADAARELVAARAELGLEARVVVAPSAVRAALSDARAVWLAGDRPWQLVDLGHEIELAAMLRAVLSRGGAVGAGSSNATLLGSLLVRGDPLDDRIVVADGYARGFDLLSGFAVDGFAELPGRAAELSRVVAETGGIRGLALDSGTAIVVSDRVAEVLGEGVVRCVTVSPDGSEVGRFEMGNGDALDLVRWAPR